MTEEDFDKDFEILDGMTWDDSLDNNYQQFKQSIEQDDDDDDDDESEEEDKEKEVLEELIKQLQLLKPVENNNNENNENNENIIYLNENEDKDENNKIKNEEVSLVSVSKHATIEISWNMLNDWDKYCQVAKNNEDNSENIDSETKVNNK